MTMILQAFADAFFFPYVVFGLLLSIGFFAYSIIVPVIHYRLGDGAIWIFFLFLLLGIAINSIRSLLNAYKYTDLLSLYACPVSFGIIYIFLARSFQKFYNRDYYPEVFRVLYIVAYSLAGLSFVAGIPSLLNVFVGVW